MEEDKKLYKEYLNGNEEAFNKIVNKYKNNLIYFISTYVKDLDVAEDIFQDSIMYIIENKEKYDNKYSLKAYLYLIAKSRALNYIKKNNKTIRLEDDLEEKELLEEIICSKERKEKILEAINKLPEEYRRVIYLTKLEKLSYKETAGIMDKKVSQIRTLAHNSKEKLKEILQKEKIIEIKGKKIIKLLVLILTIGILTSGIVYAGIAVYKKYIWKEPEKYNVEEEKKVTNEDLNEAISQEEAIEKAREIIKNLGYDEFNIEKVELIKYPDDYEMEWMIIGKEQLSINLDAYTGKLVSFSDYNLDDTKIESKLSKEEVETVITNIYEKLGYDKEEYTLTTLNKVEITEDSPLWQGDFCKIYDGIVNEFECIRLTVIPETNELRGVNIFDCKTENNPVIISEEEAIQIAKNKAKELNKDLNRIKDITAKIKFEKLNTMVYHEEMNEKEQEEKIKENTTTNQNTNELYDYRLEELVRKVWRVEIEYKNDVFTERDSYFVDCETGEILGGDSIK